MHKNEDIEIVEIGKELPPENIFIKHYAHRLEASNILCRPLPGKEAMKSSWGNEDPNWIFKTYCFVQEGKALGSFWATMANPNGNTYAWNKDNLEFDMFIQEQHRRKGLGTLAMKHLAQLAKSNSKTKLETSCGTKEGELFCKHLGAKVLFEDNQRFMALKDFDLTKLRQMTAPDPEKESEVKIEFPRQWSEQDKIQIRKFYGYAMRQTTSKTQTKRSLLSMK